MVIVKIKENSKQSKAIIEMLRTFDFVEFQEEKENNSLTKKKEIMELSKKINKEGTKKAFEKLGLDYDSYSR